MMSRPDSTGVSQRAWLSTTLHRLMSLAFLFLIMPSAWSAQWPPALKTVDVGNGIRLHYVEAGAGASVVLVHGSISDYTYWEAPFEFLSQHYHVLAYSRRYNYPNANPSRPGYSAVVDADDLAAFIEKLHLGPVYVIGHSYGGLTALFLLVRHPGIARAVVLAEPPAVSLLNHLEGSRDAEGKAMFQDIQQHMIQPMRNAFLNKDPEVGVRRFIDYVKEDTTAWNRMSASSKAETMRDAHEWDVMMTTGEFFPVIEPEAVSKINVPVLLLSGQNSYPFLNLVDEKLLRLIPNSERIVLQGATHQMLYDKPAICADEILTFLRRVENP